MDQGGPGAQVASSKVEQYTDGVNPAWLRKRNGDNIDVISEDVGVAQVDPLLTPKVFSTLLPTSGLRVPVSPYAVHSLVVRSPLWTQEAEAKHGLANITITTDFTTKF
ncbi:uncharacterized protein MYCFIDRAFT_83245, partial [Pseudocercospora fijiensis CIRAD86]